MHIGNTLSIGTYFSGGGAPFYVSQAGTGVGTQADPFGPTEFETALGDGTITSGATVKFNKGDTVELGSIDVSTANLTFDAYGTGADPIITGSEDISGLTWTDGGSGLYSASLATEPKWLFLDGVASKWAQSAYISITGRPSSTVIQANSATINAMSSIIGAKVRIIENPWIMSFEYTVTAYDPGTGNITLDRTIIGAGVGKTFALMDQLQFLTGNNQWYYDNATTTIYYKSASNPSTLDLRASVHNRGFDLNAPGITINNLAFQHYQEGAIASDDGDSSGVTISNCTITDCREYGIFVVGCDDYTISGCDILRCGNGIARTGDNWSVTNNTITTIGMDLNYPFPVGTYQSRGNGVLLWGANNTISGNTISNLAYCGTLTTGFDDIIEQNEFYDFCKRFDDGAAIYTAGVGSSVTTNSGAQIRNNYIHDAGGINDVAGIYIDNYTTSYTLTSNIITGVPLAGIYCNWSTTHTALITNIVYDCPVLVEFHENTTQALYPDNEGCVMTGNIFVAKDNTQVPVELESFNSDANFSPFSNGGSCDNNRYIIPYGTIVAQTRATAGGTATTHTLSSWRTHISGDAAAESIENLYSYTTADNAGLEILVDVNFTGNESTVPVGSDYVNPDGDVISQNVIPAYYAAVSTSTVSTPERTTIFLDNFTGASGNITGHTPDTGSAWTVTTGTISLNGSGKCIASVAGEMYQDTGDSDTKIEVTGQVSSQPAGINLLMRYTDVNKYILVQLFITSPSTSSRVILYNRTGGVSTSMIQPTFTAVINTDYKLTAHLVGNRMRVYINDVQYIDYTDSDNNDIGINNPTGTKHGVRVPTVGIYDKVTIYEP